MNKPKVTVVTVSFNQAAFLKECLESVLNQDYPNLEYIVIDGGSVDGSQDIISVYSSKLAYWVSEKDRGASDGLNTGFRKATGTIFAYLNSDDVLKPGAVAKWVNCFELNPLTSVVYGDMEIIGPKGEPSSLPGRRAKTFRSSTWSLRSHAAGAVVIPQQATAWKRAVHDKIGGFNIDNRTSWDGEYFAQAAMHGFLFSRIPEILAAFRVHGESISGTGKMNAKFEIDQKRLSQQWINAGIRVPTWEAILRKQLGRMERLFRQPSAFR